MAGRQLAPRPDELIAAFHEQAQAVPELVALFNNDPERMRVHLASTGGDLAKTIREIEPQSCLFYIDLIESAPFPESDKLYCKVAIHANDPMAVYRWLLEGVSTASGADGQPLRCSTFLYGYSIMERPSMELSQVPMIGSNVFDLWIFKTYIGFTIS